MISPSRAHTGVGTQDVDLEELLNLELSHLLPARVSL